MSSLDIKTDLPAQTSASGSKETLEDYTLRYAPLSFRRWGPGVVAVTALGGIAYLADFSIGASIGMAGAPPMRFTRSCWRRWLFFLPVFRWRLPPRAITSTST